MKRGRARDIDKIERLAVQHQVKVIVNAGVGRELHRRMAARRDRIVNCYKGDLWSCAPSSKMRRGGDFAEARNCAAQHAQPGL